MHLGLAILRECDCGQFLPLPQYVHLFASLL